MRLNPTAGLPALLLGIVLSCFSFPLHAEDANGIYQDLMKHPHDMRRNPAEAYATMLCDRFAADIGTRASADPQSVAALKNQDKIIDIWSVEALKQFMHLHSKERIRSFHDAIVPWSASVERSVAATYGTKPRIRDFLQTCYPQARELGMQYDAASSPTHP